MQRVRDRDHQILASGVEMFKGPIHPGNVGQMRAVIFAHFTVDQSVELVIHRKQEILILLFQGQIVHFMRIVF